MGLTGEGLIAAHWPPLGSTQSPAKASVFGDRLWVIVRQNYLPEKLGLVVKIMEVGGEGGRGVWVGLLRHSPNHSSYSRSFHGMRHRRFPVPLVLSPQSSIFFYKEPTFPTRHRILPCAVVVLSLRSSRLFTRFSSHWPALSVPRSQGQLTPVRNVLLSS